MKKETDLVYVQNSFWTTFFGQSKEGIEAEKEISSKSGGLPKILNIHFKSTLSQLKKAGYCVKKSKKPTNTEINEIFKELDELNLN